MRIINTTLFGPRGEERRSCKNFAIMRDAKVVSATLDAQDVNLSESDAVGAERNVRTRGCWCGKAPHSVWSQNENYKKNATLKTTPSLTTNSSSKMKEREFKEGTESRREDRVKRQKDERLNGEGGGKMLFERLLFARPTIILDSSSLFVCGFLASTRTTTASIQRFEPAVRSYRASSTLLQRLLVTPCQVTTTPISSGTIDFNQQTTNEVGCRSGLFAASLPQWTGRWTVVVLVARRKPSEPNREHASVEGGL